MRLTYWRKTTDDDAECVTIREAKRLLKTEGGQAWVGGRNDAK